MRKYVALFLTILFILLTLPSCANPFPSTEPVTQTAAQPTQPVSAPQDGSPYFQLSALPKIGSYYDNTVYKRMTDDFVDTFQPGDGYGTLLPYIGDYRLYKAEEDDPEGEWSFDEEYPRYGLMTVDGVVVTDTVFEYIYAKEGLYFLRKTYEVSGRARSYEAVIPISGKWIVEVNSADPDSLYLDASEKMQRIFVCNYEKKTVDVYDYNGKKLFSRAGADEFNTCWNAGCFTVSENRDDQTFTTLLDKNGDELTTIQGYIYSCQDCSNYLIGELVEWVRDGDEYTSDFLRGILKKDGSWLIEPTYSNAEGYGDKYFVCSNDRKTVVFDDKRKQVFSVSDDEIEPYQIEWINGELIHWKREDDSSLCYSMTGDHTPITAKGKTLVKVEPIEGTVLFFGIDKSNNGYLFTRDGTVKMTFADARDQSGWMKDGLIEIITGSEKKQTTHVIDAKTMEEKYSLVSYDAYEDVEIHSGFIENEAQRLVEYNVSAIEDDEAGVTYRVVDVETGKTLADRCEYTVEYYINGKDYYGGVKDNTAFMMDIDGNVLLRVPCSYED